MQKRVILALALSAATGCDSLHAVRIEAAPVAPTCVRAALSQAGLALVDTPDSPGHALVVERGRREGWFSADLSRAGRVELYIVAMHQPVRCEALTRVLPRMRAAASAIQSGCTADRVVISERFLNQDRCGM